MNRFNLLRATVVSLCAPLALIPSLTFAQDVAPQEQSAATAGLEEVVVTGALLGSARSLQQQHASDTLVNVISSDDFGTLPDLNAAEALQRLPGVSIVQSQGEGRFVSIRGARPNYNGTLLNGFTLPSGDRAERRVDLQVVSNPLIEQLEVYKAGTPDLPGEGIGGIVNVVQQNPGEIDRRMAGSSVFGGIQEYDGDDLRAEAYLADRIGTDGAFGYSLVASVRRGTRESYANEASDWHQVEGANGEQIWAPQSVMQSFFEIKRENLGFDAAFGGSFDRMRFDVRGLYSKFRSPNTESRLMAEDITPDADLSSRGGLVGASIGREFAYDEWEVSLRGVQARMEVDLYDDMKVDFGYAYHHAGEVYPIRLGVVSPFSDASGPLALTMRPDLVALGGANGSAPASLSAASSRIDYVQNSPRNDIEKEQTPYLNLTYDLQDVGGGNLQLKTGLYYRLRDKSTELIRDRNELLANGTLTFADLGSREIGNLGGRGIYFGQYGDHGVVGHIVADRPDQFGPSTVIRPRGLDANDFQASEDIHAYYGMATYKNGPVTAVAGARYERTDSTFVRTSDETLNGLKYFDGKTEHWLPSVHFRYDFTPELFLRTSWTNTVARPDPEVVYANEFIDRDERVITRANPALEPLESENIDVSLDWYFNELSYVSAGAFKKDIGNFPLQTTENVQFEGLTYSQVTTEAGASGEIEGIELAYRQQLDFLPGWASGFGLEVNYAAIDSELQFEGRPDRPRLTQQPSEILNASLVYAYEKFYARLALSRTGKQINAISDDGAELDEIESPRSLLDLFARYDLTDNLQVFAEWRNITNEANISYIGERSRMARWESFGTSGGVGVRWQF